MKKGVYPPPAVALVSLELLKRGGTQNELHPCSFLRLGSHLEVPVAFGADLIKLCAPVELVAWEHHDTVRYIEGVDARQHLQRRGRNVF